MAAAWARLADARASAPALARFSPAPVAALIRQKRAVLAGLSARLESASYQSVLARGFALVRDAAGHAVTAAARIAPGQALRLTFADGEVRATADGAPPRRKGIVREQGRLL
jgi:exodeoxyribonuclease VII large subunit